LWSFLAAAAGRLSTITSSIVEHLLDALFQRDTTMPANSAILYHPSVNPNMSPFKIAKPRLLSTQLSINTGVAGSVLTNEDRKTTFLKLISTALTNATHIFDFEISGYAQLAAVNWTKVSVTAVNALDDKTFDCLKSCGDVLAVINATMLNVAAADATNVRIAV
jgi:hypothetical protein